MEAPSNDNRPLTYSPPQEPSIVKRKYRYNIPQPAPLSSHLYYKPVHRLRVQYINRLKAYYQRQQHSIVQDKQHQQQKQLHQSQSKPRQRPKRPQQRQSRKPRIQVHGKSNQLEAPARKQQAPTTQQQAEQKIGKIHEIIYHGGAVTRKSSIGKSSIAITKFPWVSNKPCPKPIPAQSKGETFSEKVARWKSKVADKPRTQPAKGEPIEISLSSDSEDRSVSNSPMSISPTSDKGEGKIELEIFAENDLI